MQVDVFPGIPDRVLDADAAGGVQGGIVLGSPDIGELPAVDSEHRVEKEEQEKESGSGEKRQ
jgi:hypothetical protein